MELSNVRVVVAIEYFFVDYVVLIFELFVLPAELFAFVLFLSFFDIFRLFLVQLFLQ